MQQLKSCDVVAIEPSSSNFNILNINISKNKLNDKIIAYPLIMSDENKLEKFFKIIYQLMKMAAILLDLLMLEKISITLNMFKVP